ncbi:hypothetical protein [Armatimonas rosea]|uniref:Uncharacterized protein n=1 Tax=Armatimonas rosea TaxID=685828 RepID=A0A7W9SVM6_ARMRO|nr:hypothetical protein [Armatimonas rosea]MBB6053696.1 hypothetical protein [Armatimonas rosea]
MRRDRVLFGLVCLVLAGVGIDALRRFAFPEIYNLYTRRFLDKEIIILQKMDISPYNTWTVFVVDKGTRKLVLTPSSREQGNCIKEIFLSKDQRYIYLKAISASAGFDLASGNITHDPQVAQSSLSEHGGAGTQLFPPYDGQMQQREISEWEAQAWLKLAPTAQNQ